MDVNFDELVQDSEKLLMDVQGYTDLPYIARSLDQLRTFGDKLHLSRGPRSDVKAARLLGNKMSYELPEQLSSKLEAIESHRPATTESLTPSSKLDIQTFLKTERENAFLDVIAMSQNSLFEDIESRTTRTIRSWWDQEASAILSTLASSSSPLDTDLLHHTTTNESILDVSGLRTNRLSLCDQSHASENRTREELCYARQVDRFLSTKLQSHSTSDLLTSSISSDLLVFLSDANSATPDSNISTPLSRSTGTGPHSDLLEIWRLFRRFADVLPSSSASRNSTASKMESRMSPTVQNALIDTALSHLEVEFVSYLHVTVANHPRLARLGGRPGTRTLVKAYLNICLPNTGDGKGRSSVLDRSAGDTIMMSDEIGYNYEDGLADSKPVWPMIYYCLRAGDFNAAIEVAASLSGNFESFSSILSEYMRNGRHLLPKTMHELRQVGVQVDKMSHDPYKRLVFSILGLCNATDNHAEVAQSIDDFLWVKLSQVAASSGSTTATPGWTMTGEPIRLSQLQTLLHDTYGEVHFDAWSQPLVYFKLLCLTQQFEAAIAFLSRFEALRSHALHIALALHNRQLLLLSDSIQLPLISRNETDPIGLRRLNLARLVMLYTHKFELSNPVEALMYFYFLSDVKSTLSSSSSDSEELGDKSPSTSDNLFVTCLTELLFGTREFDFLVGSFSDSGMRKAGAVDHYCPDMEERQQLIGKLARAFENRGQLLDAINLNQLAAETCPKLGQQFYRKALGMISHLLAGLVATDSSSPTSASAAGVGLSIPSCRPIGKMDRAHVIRMATKLARRLRNSDFGSGQPQDTYLPGGDDLAEFSSSDVGLKILYYMLDLATFFDLIHVEQWQSAVDHMDQLGLFPTNPQFTEVESKVTFFTQLPDYVRQPIPAALLASMQALVQLAKKPESRSSELQLDSRSKISMPALRNRAKALVAYVGRIPYKLSGDVYARITQMNMEIM